MVKEDREEQEKLRQHQEEARAATKVTACKGFTILLSSILISNFKTLTMQLQACWRGCMVRRGLGSFKKADEGKKSQKGKKTKDGKKKKGKK